MLQSEQLLYRGSSELDCVAKLPITPQVFQFCLSGKITLFWKPLEMVTPTFWETVPFMNLIVFTIDAGDVINIMRHKKQQAQNLSDATSQ